MKVKINVERELTLRPNLNAIAYLASGLCARQRPIIRYQSRNFLRLSCRRSILIPLMFQRQNPSGFPDRKFEQEK